MHVNEPRQYPLASGVNELRILRNFHVASDCYFRYAVATNDYGRVPALVAGADIYQSSAHDYKVSIFRTRDRFLRKG
jgi:hypothetical protein